MRVGKDCILESISQNLLTLEICHLHFANTETELKMLCACPHLVKRYCRGLMRIQKCLVNNTKSKQIILQHINQTYQSKLWSQICTHNFPLFLGTLILLDVNTVRMWTSFGFYICRCAELAHLEQLGSCLLFKSDLICRK